MNKKKNSQISGFYKKSIIERLEIIQNWSNLEEESIRRIQHPNDSLTIEQASHMIENVIGIYGLPMGIATNFRINRHDYLIPMVIEEPSVVAAVSKAAKMFRHYEGFITSSDESIMIGQVQILDIEDIELTTQLLEEHKESILDKANEINGSLIRRGGGARNIELRRFRDTSIGNMIILHLLMDTCDAMGANAINTTLEYIAPMIESITQCRVNLCILSNLSDKRKARASGVIPKNILAEDNTSGEDAVNAIIEAGVFAEIDPYRATTHNKGIMNGIDAVALATGNDWRAIEAGAHAYAARSGTYSSLTQWRKTDEGDLHGEIEIPLAVGIVGGATKVHPIAQIALKILNVKSAQELAEVMAAVGLAQNFAAIRALATEGIQHGHMRMHARQVALAAGANAEFVQVIAERMIQEKNIRVDRAKEILRQMKESE